MTEFFSGKVSFTTKVIFLALTSAVLLMLSQSAFARSEYFIAAFLLLAVIALNIVYLTKISIPLKFFLPGLLFLLAFVIGPILYTFVMSTYKYQTGNMYSKEFAIERITQLGTEPDASETTFDLVKGKLASGEYAILASDIVTKRYFISTKNKKIELNPIDVKINSEGVGFSTSGFTELTPNERPIADKVLSSQRFFYAGDYFLTLEGGIGAVKRQVLEYKVDKDLFLQLVTGDLYTDNGRGNYVNVKNKDLILEPGWRSPIWFENYRKLFLDDKVRGALLKVFLWTVTFAGSSVLTTFSFGLLLALALNRPIFGRRVYRSILILPYAMPSIMSILIWGGMFDTEFGAINNLLGTHIAWFQDPNFARAAIILVNLWLGFPYFYLVSSGALQAIPVELMEAAAIDGANPRQIFRKITLPLLLKILSPLLVASFAFNFNNFNLIYLLTGGGPKDTLSGEIAGATDILISYTYKIAFDSNTQDLALASAISVIIFVIIAAISLYGIKKSKVLESFV